MLISIVIPTHNRVASLMRTLNALGRQEFPAAAYEVIVVADGCTDDTVARAEALNPPFALRCLVQEPARGAAAARNRGAAVATGEILLFLDDDMEACPAFLNAHLQAQRDMPGTVVLGYFPMHPPVPDEDRFAAGARQWWADQFAQRASDGYRFSFRDFCTGNVSLPRKLFERSGGFSESIDARAAGEDYELGYRLLRQGVRFQFVRAAETTHHSIQTLEGQLARARQEGLGQSMISRSHPELFREFPVSCLSRLAESRWLRRVWKLSWQLRGVSQIDLLFSAVYRTASALNLEVLAQRAHQQRRYLAYFLGVRDAFGSLEAWERLRQDAPCEPPGIREIEIDVARDLPHLDRILSETPADAVRLSHAGHPIGRIAPWPGAEFLRPVHVWLTLLHQYSGVMLGIAVEERLSARKGAAA